MRLVMLPTRESTLTYLRQNSRRVRTNHCTEAAISRLAIYKRYLAPLGEWCRSPFAKRFFECYDGFQFRN